MLDAIVRWLNCKHLPALNPNWFYRLEVWPSWLVCWCVWRQFPPLHPWRQRGRMYTLYEWTQGAKPPTVIFSRVCWMVMLAFAFTISVTIYRHYHT